MNITIYTKGLAEPNPGKLGYAAVLVASDDAGNILKHIARAGYKDEGTNNQAAILAAVLGVMTLARPCAATVISDSQYLVNVMTGQWASEKNGHDFRVLRMACQQHVITWQWASNREANTYAEQALHAAQIALITRGSDHA